MAPCFSPVEALKSSSPISMQAGCMCGSLAKATAEHWQVLQSRRLRMRDWSHAGDDRVAHVKLSAQRRRGSLQVVPAPVTVPDSQALQLHCPAAG